MEGPSKEDEDLGEEKREVIETVLPANNGTDHEQASTAEDHRGEKNDDFGVRRSWRIGRE